MPKHTDELSRKRRARQFMRKLDPAVVKGNLINAGLFLVAFDLLKSDIVKGLKSHYLVGDWYGDRHKIDPMLLREYESEVSALDKKDEYKASCLWLVEKEVFTKEDMAVAFSIR